MQKVQWNFNRNSNIFIQENAFERIICEMAAMLSRPQCVKFYFEIDFNSADNDMMCHLSTKPPRAFLQT